MNYMPDEKIEAEEEAESPMEGECPVCGGGGIVENPALLQALEAGEEPEEERMYIACTHCDAYARVVLGL